MKHYDDWSDVGDASLMDARIEIWSILASYSVHPFFTRRGRTQAVHNSRKTLDDVRGRSRTRRWLLASYCKPAFSPNRVPKKNSPEPVPKEEIA